ncbi:MULTISPECIES: AI-2E family transporter [unclassified Jeotgalibaca]|uniref:AI-2E family transporter n=1 Tax=unclassified Jeotgalibaca TaxID=2621505 RepID=UPI003FD0F35E
MIEKEKRRTPATSDQRFIRFFGGNKLLFSLVVLIMLGILVMIYNQISFIFTPLRVIFSTIVAPVILAIVFFYILNPLVTFLEKRKVNRTLGTAIVFIIFLLLLTWGIVSLIPILVSQITSFVEAFPQYIDTLTSRFEEFIVGSPFESYYHDATEKFDSIVGDIPAMIWNWVNNSSQRIVSVFSTISNVVVVLVTFPIILFFMLTDRGKFKPFIMKMTPPVWRNDLNVLGNRMTEVLGSYIVGEGLVALSLGGILLIGYLIIGLDYAFALTVIATITAVIPFIGATIGIIPAVVVAAFTSPSMLLKMAVVWVIAQTIQGNLIEPNIIGKSLKMHPLTIIIVLLIMGNLLGLIGMILGIPIFAIIQVLFEHIFEKFKKHYNRFYGDVAGHYEFENLDD